MAPPTLTILPGCTDNCGTSDEKGLLDPIASVLSGWPRHLNHPLAWHGNDFTTEDQYIYLFSSSDKSEIQSALDHFKSLELDGSDITEQNFPLPNLGERLHALSEGLHHGKGFFMLRGLDPTTFSVEDNALLYLGLSSYIAPTRGKQDEEGNMFLHIREAKEMAAPQTERPARDSNTRLAYHTDQFPDILALYCRGRAETGGNHNIASSYAIYNELLITRPDVLETLASPDWYFDSRSLFVHPERRPLLFNYQGHIILNFGRIHLMATEPTDDGTFAPKPTAKQLEALDLVQQLAEKHHLSLNMDPGDLTFINNLGILHAREEFTDSPENTRYLVRMWLKNEDKAWPLPRTLKRGNDRTYDMAAEEIWNILPAPRVAFKIRDKYGP
ncbi:Clavaminate synthase [Fusarium sp. NRRL 52700]|nr:Clavaminate synthase [Fusarium sp. NRRL 52700]